MQDDDTIRKYAESLERRIDTLENALADLIRAFQINCALSGPFPASSEEWKPHIRNLSVAMRQYEKES